MINRKMLRLLTLLVVSLSAFPLQSWSADQSGYYLRSRAKQADVHSVRIHPMIKLKNTTGRAFPFSRLKLSYPFQRDNDAVLHGKLLQVKSAYSDASILPYSNIKVLEDSIEVTFDPGAGNFGANKTIVITFAVTPADGQMVDQSNDPAFIPVGSKFWYKNPAISVEELEPTYLHIPGRVLDQNDDPVAGALIQSASVSTTSDALGYFNLYVPKVDMVVLTVSHDGSPLVADDGYADEVVTYFAEELEEVTSIPSSSTSNQPSSSQLPFAGVAATPLAIWRGMIIRLTPRSAFETLYQPRHNREISTVNGTKIVFPETSELDGINPFRVHLTSLTLSEQEHNNLDLNRLYGAGSSVEIYNSNTRVKLFGVIDVIVTDTSGRRMDLRDLNLNIEVHIRTTCADQTVPEVDVLFMEHNAANGGWKNHSSKAQFDTQGTACFYKFMTNHFTKYALVKTFTSDAAELVLDASNIVGSSDSAASNRYRVEVQSRRGLISRLEVDGNKLNGLVIADVPTDQDLVIRVTDTLDDAGSSLRLTNMGAYTNKRRTVTLNAMGTLSWINTWYNFDSPTGTGDFELSEYWGPVACQAPFAMQVRNVATNIVYESAEDMPDVIRSFDLHRGFECVNDHQPDGLNCDNYAIRLKCPNEE